MRKRQGMTISIGRLGLLLLVLTATPVAADDEPRATPKLMRPAGRPGGTRRQEDTRSLADYRVLQFPGVTSLWPNMPDASGALLTFAPDRTLTGRSIVGLDVSPSFRWTKPGGFFGLRFGGVHEVDTDPTPVNFMSALYVDYVSQSTTDAVAPWLPDMIVEKWSARLDGADHAAQTGRIPIGFAAIPAIEAANGAQLTIRDRCASSCDLDSKASCRQATEAVDCAGCAGGTTGACTEHGGLMTIYAYPKLKADAGSSLSVVRRAVVFDRGVLIDAADTGHVTLDTDNTIFIADRDGAETIRAVESRLHAGNRKFFLYAEGDAPSVHTGRVRIGDTHEPGAALDLAPGRDKHLRMAGAAEDPADPRPGDAWYNTTHRAHRTRAAIGTLGQTGVLATITADSEPLGTATTEHHFSNGTFSIPSDSLGVGKTIRIRAGGRYASRGAGARRLTVRWGTDATGDDNVLIDTGSLAMPPGPAEGAWTLDADVTVRAVGSDGSAVGRGVATFGGAGAPALVTTDARLGATAIDTSVETMLTLGSTWGAAGSIVLEMATVEVLD